MEFSGPSLVTGGAPQSQNFASSYGKYLSKSIPIDEKNVLNIRKSNLLKLTAIKSQTKMADDFEPLQALKAQDPVGIEFHNLSYSISRGRNKDMKTILNSVSGKFEPGKLVGIIGPSGAGKTSLMNVLAGFQTTNVTGSIKVNGTERDLKYFRGQSCYIMQDETLLKFLSVQESMQIAVILKLGPKLSKERKATLITRTLETMRLKNVQLSRVGSLSGGERKRLSIALELVNNPPLMFFDEPTSGLDSLNSFNCIAMLKCLAEQGKTVICSIHQPSAKVFELFDQIYGMAEGHCIYNGSSNLLVPFLTSHDFECPTFHNPADFLIEVASGQYGSFIQKLKTANSQPKFYSDPANTYVHVDAEGLENGNETKLHLEKLSIKDDLKLNIGQQEDCLSEECPRKCVNYSAPFYVQCVVLFIRTFRSIWRDMMLTFLRFGAHLVTGLMIGALYYKVGNDAANIYSNLGLLFFNLLFLLFTAMMPTIVTFPLEMPVFVREHFNHWYSIKSYYIAKTMADFPFQIAFPVMYIVIVYFMTGQPLDPVRFLLLTYFTIMTSLIAQSVGLAVGAAVDIQHAVFCGPVVSVPAMLFSGFFVSFKTMPSFFKWISYTSYLRYGYEGTLISIYGMNRDTLDCSDAFCMLKDPTKIFSTLGIDEDFLVYDALILLVYFIIVRIIGYFVLKWKLSKEH